MAEVTTPGLRLLVVDDNNLVCWALERELSAHCAEIALCHNGKDALGRLREAAYDLAIVDVHLPDANGIDVLEKIRKISPGTRAIAISADTSVATIRGAIAAGADLFVEKPFEPSVIRGHVENMFRSYSVPRRHPRHACRIPVRISVLAPLPPGAGLDLDNVKGIAENVAPGGFRVATNFPLAAGQVVRVNVGSAEPADPLVHFIPPRATAEVRWATVAPAGFSAGLSFISPPGLRQVSPVAEA